MGIKHRWFRLKRWWNEFQEQKKDVRFYYNRKRIADFGRRATIASLIMFFAGAYISITFCCVIQLIGLLLVSITTWTMVIAPALWIYGSWKDLEYL